MGRFLVLLQLVLIVSLLVPLRPWHVGILSLIFAFFCVGMFVWTISANRIGNWNIRPEVKPSAQFVASGPYRLVRHPMYVSILLGAAAVLSLEPTMLKFALTLLLFGVLYAKASMEEHYMGERFPEYADYARNTGKFVPRLF